MGIYSYVNIKIKIDIIDESMKMMNKSYAKEIVNNIIELMNWVENFHFLHNDVDEYIKLILKEAKIKKITNIVVA